MKSRTTWIFTLLVLAVAAGGDAAPELRALQPLERDRVWRYETERGTALEMRVGKRDPIGRETYARLETRVDGRLVQVEWVRLDRDRLLVAKRETAGEVWSFDPPQPILAGPLEPGTTWTWEGRMAGPSRTLDARMTFEIAGEESVTVTAGAFQAWRIEAEGRTSDGGEVSLVRFYAAGVGLIREEATFRVNRERDTGIELVSIELPRWLRKRERR